LPLIFDQTWRPPRCVESYHERRVYYGFLSTVNIVDTRPLQGQDFDPLSETLDDWKNGMDLGF